MALIETDTITLPAYWASAIINDDWTGISDDAEAERCRRQIDQLAMDGWRIVSTEGEAYFTWSYKVHDPGADCTGGEVIDYVIYREARR